MVDIAHDKKGRLIRLGGLPVREVPPGFMPRFPKVDESTPFPPIRWYARHHNGRLTPVVAGMILPSGDVVE